MSGIIRRIDREVLPQVNRPTLASAPQATGLQALGAGLGEVGDMFAQWQDEIDTADAMKADAGLTDRINDLLYNDQTGFMYQTGGNAIAARQSVAEQIEAWREETLSGLSPAARRRADAAVTARIQSTLQRVNEHTASERRGYLTEAANARIESSINAAIYDPAGPHLDVALGALRDRAAREGWAPEVLALEEGKVRSQTYSGVITRMANTDPQGALDYLNANRSNLTGEEATRLEAALRPVALEAQGRALGAAAAGGGVSPTYLASIRSAESGGNDLARNPNSSATGRYQFTSGTWLDLMRDHPELGLTATGRTDPAQQERAIQAFTADNAKRLQAAGIQPTGGNLYAAHFLGAGGAASVLTASPEASVASIVGAQVVQANPFLANMTVADFRAWADRKGGGSSIAFASGDGGMDALLAIEDPEVREAALREYDLRTTAAATQQEQAQRAASQQVFQALEQGGRIADMPVELRTALAGDVMEAARAYERSIASGVPIQTDDAEYVRLRTLADSNPQEFARTDPMLWRNSLSDGDFRQMVELQSKIRTEGVRRPDLPSVSSMMGEANAQLRAAGIIENETPEQYAAIQRNLVNWADANPDLAADPVQRDAFVRRQLVPVVLRAPGTRRGIGDLGLFSDAGTRLAEIDFDGNPLDSADDITVSDLLNGALSVGGEAVSRAEIMDLLAQSARILGRQPSPPEIIDLLIKKRQ